MIVPMAGKVLVNPKLNSQIRAEDVKKRSGLLMPDPDNKRYAFEGIPNQGLIYALPAGYDGPLKVGMHVAYTETAPKGFKDPETGDKLFSLDLQQIAAEVKTDA